MKLIIDIHEEDYKIINNSMYEDSGVNKRLYSAVHYGTPIPDNANEKVLEQITAEIYEHFMTIDGGVHDKSAIKCMEIIGKYKGDKE